ncbi:hypothetical protein IPJ72_01915 [Candidatus Peregrinibacteria bacterium]|nr:MAG: hypothetical protein IPJ72_01915 [Candidatus Peregrinibacteria bacterium]
MKSYDATIRTSRLKTVCDDLAQLKAREDIIFENSAVNDDQCSFRFKVKKENALEVVQIIEALQPDYFNTSIQSIQSSVEFYDKQLEISQKKLASIEETLADALKAYDDVNRLAVQKQDVESLATIINNKLGLIERMSQERINVQQQIDSYQQQKADQLDRLQYQFFNVNVYKDVLFDWQQIKDSWNQEVKSFVFNFNQIIQQLSVGLVTYLLRFVQAMIYLFLSLFLIKMVWMGIKRVWRGHSMQR